MGRENVNNYNVKRKQLLNHFMIYAIGLICLMLADQSFAATRTLGDMASNITDSFTSLTKLVTAGSYLAGLGFAIAAILKFKQHKDNPTQIQVGTPIALVFIAAALLFMPALMSTTGETLFGTISATDYGGPTGIIFRPGS